jgi:hypothetical protein
LVISAARQEVIGVKEVGLVECRFQPNSFEVRHVRAPGQIDVDLDSLQAIFRAATNREYRLTSGGSALVGADAHQLLAEIGALQ